MLCKKCGTNIAETAKFCGFCGNPIEQNNVNTQIISEDITNEVNLQAFEKTESTQAQLETTINETSETVELKSNKKNNKILIIILIVFALFIITISTILFIDYSNNKKGNDKQINSQESKSTYWISSNSLEPFDLYFLQLENEKQNKIYSPLSIKYALKMLEEGANGESKTQISNIIGDYNAKKYINSKNMSFANAFFIKDTYRDSINDNYINSLINKYNAEVKIDSFATPNTVNSWVSNKTLGLINNLFDDISQQEFFLINALAIDMDWEEKFISPLGSTAWLKYLHEDFSWIASTDVISGKFDKMEQDVSGMNIIASFNNYDIVKELGEQNIRQTVKTEFIKYLEENPDDKLSNYFYNEDITGLNDDELMEKYLDKYIEQINSNYKKEDRTTDFSLYVDENVKVFAKDLKEYDGTILQYVGIMPINEDLDSYINNITAPNLNNIVSNLKELKAENFKDGVVTKITGFIPKFKFEYELNLKTDLKKLGITNVFEQGKANLTNISSDSSLCIGPAIHKANIEFTQDGIKAAAATGIGGLGAGGGFDYIYEVPVEEIDLTFDKPYMFIIRDKNSGEVWFTGTVYNPLLYSKDTTIYRPIGS